MKGGFARAWLLLLACGIAAGCAPKPDPRLTALTGSLWIAGCDSPSCERPRDDDPRWVRAALGPSGVDRRLPHREGIAWVRVAFVLGDARRFNAPALLISHPADAEEAFLNDVPVGGEGRIGVRYVTAPSSPRMLALPAGALREGANLLTMKVLFAEKNMSIFDGALLFGDRDRIAAEAEKQRRPIIGTEASFLTLFALLLAFHVFLMVKGVIRFENILFTGFTATYALKFLLGSNLLYLSGIASPRVEHLQAVLSSMIVPWMLALVTSATGARFGAAFWLFAAGAAAFIALDAVMAPLNALRMLATPRKAFVALRGLYYLVLAGRSVIRRREDSLPVLVGVAAYVIGSRVDLFWGLNMQDYSLGVFALCMLFALTSRHARTRSRLMEVSARLLDAHEEERSRIARDIHDSVGQSLLALKMRVQMLAATVAGGTPAAPEALKTLSEDAAAIIDEVRRTSMDLRPSFVASMSLAEAVSWYAASFAERSGIDIQVHRGDETPARLPPRVTDNLYRALQEILANAAKHSQATRIGISVYRSGRSIVLRVADNGTGIAESAGKGTGIGLSTLRERAELLGGTCSVVSARGRGTTVTWEVPVP